MDQSSPETRTPPPAASPSPDQSGVGPATLAAPRRREPPDPLADAPKGVQAAADGDADDLTRGEERGALDFLLGATRRLEFDCDAWIETEHGLAKLTFRLGQLGGEVFQRAEREHSVGGGPLAEVDEVAMNAAVVAAATLTITDETGRAVEPASEEFRGGMPSAALAMQGRFTNQPGVLRSLAEEVRRISGYSFDRVGSAQRVLVDAVGNSSTSAG